MSEKHYFACGNTAKGFQNLFASNLQNLERIYILKGGPGNGKSTLMKRVGKKYEEKYAVEYIHCSSDAKSLDGVIVRELGFGIVDGTAPHVIEPLVPGCVEQYINMGAAWTARKLKTNQDKIMKIQSEIASCYPRAYEAFARGIKVHDEWENIYIGAMDFDKANEMTETVIKDILKDYAYQKEGKVYHRFFGASTCDGSVDFVENIIEPVKNRYFIKGRPGSGKSTLLKKLLAHAQMKGLDVEVYHCGFDPNSLDMILIPELDTVIFDSTAPHEYFPSREEDVVVDMYRELIAENTDEVYAVELEDIVSRYRACISEGVSYLKKAKDLHDKLEEYYIKGTEFGVTEVIMKQLMIDIERECEGHKS